MKFSKSFFTNITILLIFVILSSCSFFGKKEENNLNTAEAVLQHGDDLFEQGRYKEALAAYQSLLIDFPTSDLHIEDQLRIAETYGKMDNFEKQMDVLLQLLKENIIPEKVPEVYCQIGQFYERAAMFNSGMVTSDTMDYREALNYYKKAYDYIDSDDQMSKSKALYRSGLVNAKLGNYQESTNFYNLVISKFPNSPYSTLAKMKLKSISDTSELSLSDEAMKSYREILGLQVPVASKESSREEETVQPENEDMFNQSESNMLDNSNESDEEINTQQEEQEPAENEAAPAEESQIEEPAVETEENQEEIPQETPQEEIQEQEAAGDSTSAGE
jgi:tetratricopeptide (TPR) repeat protein